MLRRARCRHNPAMTRHHQAVSLEQAAGEAPALGSLLQRIQHLQACARCIETAIPPAMRAHIHYGAVENGEWCILVNNPAVAAKARQLIPIWIKRLQNDGMEVTSIRLRLTGSLQN